MALDIDSIIKEWWDSYQADSRSSFDRIVSGMRKELYTADGKVVYPGGIEQTIGKSLRQTGSCQYWVNGLPAVCKYWNVNQTTTSGICTFEFETTEDKPSGYGLGSCDALGRRSWCSKYDPSTADNLSEYVCVLPCIERSGKGKQVESELNTISYRAILPSEIQGYNIDESGVGRCDGWGLGRGNQQTEYESLEELYQHGPICKYYRPQQMGFGAIQPHPYHGSEVPGKPFDASVNTIPSTLEELHDGSNADPLVVMPKRLPFIFQVYNARAMYQQCNHWKNNRPSFFRLSTDQDVGFNNIELEDEIYCEFYNEEGIENLSSPYWKYKTEWPEGVPWVLAGVVAEYGGVVCNGAKPECPCYTGKWIYCTDNNMRDGMRITADQIFELRFWASNWSSQEEYEAYYKSKPGRTFNDNADETTADIYTFTKWLRLDVTDPNNSIMQGYRHTMCMPAPLHAREFVPDNYITKELITYPKLNQYTGTNTLNEDVSFPTLVRELDDPENFVPDIEIIYPYNTLDPWSFVPCQEEEIADFCIHNTTLMENPNISVIGQSPFECEIYIINDALIEKSSETVKAFEYMDTYTRAFQIIDVALWVDYNQKISRLISYCEEQEQGYTVGTSNDVGFFNIDVELKCNDYNKLYVICKYNTDADYSEFTFRKVNVKSVYWAAVIYQKSMSHTHFESTQLNAYPSHFEPAPTLTAEVIKTTGTVESVVPLYYHEVKTITATKSYYGYCINEYNSEEEVEYWTQIGSTGYVWAEIDNIELSYLWEFEVEEAYMEVKTSEDSDGNVTRNFGLNLCGAADNTQTTDIKIYLSQIDISRRNIPPNAVLFKASKPMGFFNSDWKLIIKYKYRLLETFKSNVVWPANVDEQLGNAYFRDCPFSVTHESNASVFEVSGAGTTSKATMRVLALLGDEYGRLQAAAATKLLVQGYVLGCRNVEIEYIYSAPSKSYQLQPVTGFSTWRGVPKALPTDGDGGYHARQAYCGDHDCDPDDCIGPMWYPFESCVDGAYYNSYTGAAYCLLPVVEGEEEIEKMGVGAWRYEGPDEYFAWVTEAGNWLQTCGAQWKYYYSQAEIASTTFVGSAHKRANVDYGEFNTNGWTHPPFGNASRAFIERYLSKDYYPYIDLSGTSPSSAANYLPLVFDKEDLSSNPDPFSGSSFIGGDINYFSMLNNYVANFIDEEITEERYRFEDIIEVHQHTMCSYPEPVTTISEDGVAVFRYGFKNESHIWAWREYWRPIDRNNYSTHGKFNFLELYKPDYYFDSLKEEHRLITYEGIHTIVFEPPQAPSVGDSDDITEVYPSISLDGAHPRYFNIIYDSYTDGYVDWKDESSTGEVNSSDGENIYEQTNNSDILNGFDYNCNIQWVHNFNCIFDNDASIDPDEDRKIYLGLDPTTYEPLYGYYNRGINIYIPKNKLKFLPIAVSSVGTATASVDTEESFIGYWTLGGVFGVAPIEIIIEGFYGTETYADGSEVVYSQPYIKVAESENVATFSDGADVPDWPSNSVVGFTEYITGANIEGIIKYNIKLELERTPQRLTQTLMYFMVNLYAMPGEQLNITEFEINTGKYTAATEQIKVWECKYKVGIGVLPSSNADGPNTEYYRMQQMDYENSGQFYPMNLQTTDTARTSGNGSVISKATMVSFGEQYTEDEEIEVTIDNLRDVEKDAQRELYEEATDLEDYDELKFTGIIHPALEYWYNELNINAPAPINLIMNYEKVLWENSKYPAWLNQEGDMWWPGGHYFVYSDTIEKAKCYSIGPVQTIYSVQYVHYRHGSSEDVMDPGHAYAGWGRTEYYNGVLWGQTLSGEEATEPDLLTGAVNGIMAGGDV